MKVWMLTGDKGETARQIGQSCGILNSSMQIINIKTEQEIKEVSIE